MKNETLTPAIIFASNQILTLEIAKTLIGKRVACTNPEYHANRPSVEIFTIKGFISEWDRAKDEASGDNEKFANRQEYWASYMKPDAIEEKKRRITIINDGNGYYTCEMENPCFDEPTFFGSDADREVYYVLIK